MHLEKVKIRKIIGPTPSGAAILLGNERKTFVVFVGFYESAALLREINHEVPARPLTHELIQSVFLGFDVEVKRVIISSIIENTFCATLVLQQKVTEGNGEWSGRRNEVRIDARPSDCLVLALKNKVDIFVTAEVFERVQDVSKMTGDIEGNLAGLSLNELEIDVRGGSGLESEGAGPEKEPADEFPEDDGEEEGFETKD